MRLARYRTVQLMQPGVFYFDRRGAALFGAPVSPGPATFLKAIACRFYGSGDVMLNQLPKPRGFGVDDKPPCSNCAGRMSLTRRGPRPDYGLRYERQIFTCFGCDQEVERIVDANANNPIEHINCTADIEGAVR
jgi:hypothetical protein